MLSFETQIHFALLRILHVGTPKPKQKGKKTQKPKQKTPQAYEHLWKRQHNVGLRPIIFKHLLEGSHKQEVTEEIKKHTS